MKKSERAAPDRRFTPQGDLRVALDAADAMPPAFGRQLRAALKLLPAGQKKVIAAIARAG